MKYLFRYVKPYYGKMALGLFIKASGAVMELLIPFILGYIIDEVVPKESAATIILWGLMMILCAFLAFLFNVTANRISAKVAKGSSRAVRHDLFAKIMRLSCGRADKFTIPSLESRLTTDTYNFHRFVGAMQRMGVRGPLLLVGGLVITMLIDWRMSLIMSSILPFIAVSVLLISKKGVPMYRAVQKSVDGMTRVVREDAQGIRVIKALSRTDYEKDRYDRENKELVGNEKQAGVTMAATHPIMSFCMNIGIVAVIFVGGILVNGGLTKPGKILTFMQYFTIISQSMLTVTRIFVMYTKSSASASRISEVLTCEDDMQLMPPEKYPPENDGKEGYITFDNVSFSYGNNKSNLENISFSIQKSGTLGIIGATGAGKSTIVSLLMRLYDVSSGSVRIGGQDVRTIEPDRLHSMFGAAMQNDFIYADTIKQNLLFGRKISDEDLKKAVHIAQADFIGDFEGGFEHMLAAKGTNVSGGQRQRLLIARALAGKPDILILDDSSSALDYKTDAALRRAIAEETGDTTVVIVAQRISSVMNADLIIVLDEGKIIGMGDHESLMRDCEIYREISVSQMGGAFLE